jgi:hypothetical protein
MNYNDPASSMKGRNLVNFDSSFFEHPHKIVASPARATLFSVRHSQPQWRMVRRLRC